MIERSAAECMVMEVDAPYSSAGEGGAVIRVPRGASLPELTSIQLPCMVRTHAQALDVIEGGKQTIDACMTGGMASGLHHQIYASLDGPAAAAVADGPRCLLTGTPRPAQGLLVKLVRRRTRGADGAVVRESVTTEVLGKVTKEYQFSTPFDFQFVGGSDEVKILTPESGTEACEIIPQPFRVTLDPDAVSALFAPKASVIARDGTQQSQEEAQPPPKRSSHKAAGGRNPGVRVRYEDPVVGAPPEEVLASLNKVRRNPEYDRLSGDAKALLQVAFRARPVWLRSALGSLLMPAPDGSRTVREVFAGSSSHVFREIVYLSGFTFMDGPWARCWVKYGLNVRESPECRWYQAVAVSNSRSKMAEIQKKIRAKSLGYRVAEFHLDSRTVVLDSRGSNADDTNAATAAAAASISPEPALLLFGIELNPMSYFQLCDIGDEDFLRYVSTTKRTSACSPKTGWFTAPTWTEIKRRVSAVVANALTEANAAMDDFDSYLRTALAKASSGDRSPHEAIQCSALSRPYDLAEHLSLPEGCFLQRYLSIPDVVATESDILVETISAITGAGKDNVDKTSRSTRSRRPAASSSSSEARASTRSRQRMASSSMATSSASTQETTESVRRSSRKKNTSKLSSSKSNDMNDHASSSASHAVGQLLPSLQMVDEVEAFDIFGGDRDDEEEASSNSSDATDETDENGGLSEEEVSMYSRTESSDSEAEGSEEADDDVVAEEEDDDDADYDDGNNNHIDDRVRGASSRPARTRAAPRQSRRSARVSEETVEERILRELASINTVYTV